LVLKVSLRSRKVSAGFAESVARFEKFIETHGCPGHVVWVRPEDVLVVSPRRVLIKLPVSPENGKIARTVLEEGLEAQLGVLFATLCQIEGTTYCYAWAPRDADEAEGRLMPSGLKMSVMTGEYRLQGKPVKNGLRWRWLKWRYRKQQQHKAWLFQ
jgi:hypothetical protein